MLEVIVPVLSFLAAIIGLVKSYWGLSLSFRGTFQLIIEDSGEQFIMHIFNRTSHNIHIFGVFFANTDILRLLVKTSICIGGYSQLSIPLSKTDFSPFLSTI